MSLDSNQITANNFKAFYEQIRPYLNGSFPTPIANKFSKSDMYSTDERIVGQWIDGKPLYQKTIVLSNISKTVMDVNHGISDIDTIVTWEGYLRHRSDGRTIKLNDADPDGTQFTTRCVVGKTTFSIWANNYPGDYVWTGSGEVTIQYTKTTDTADSFKYANPTDYSTTEKIVGTWIDGKPIYQKTVSCGTGPNNDLKEVSHGINDIDTIIKTDGLDTHNDSDKTGGSLPWVDRTSFLCGIWADKNKIYLRSTYNASGSSYYCTLQYTKTTD